MKKFIKNILWPTDFSAEAQEALAYGCLFAEKFSAKLIALHVVPDFSPALFETTVIQSELLRHSASLKKRAEAKLRAVATRKGIAFQKIIITEGSPAKKIVETAESEKADLIVMGRKGQSRLEKILIGSVANHVLRHSLVPLLLTKKGKRKLTIKKILVPTDFTKGEDIERDVAWALAKAFGASLTLLYVLELYGHEFRMVDQMFEEVMQKFKQRAEKFGKGIPMAKDVIKAVNAATGIVDYSRRLNFDLIVMASCSRGLGRFFLGSTTEKVLSLSGVPIFVLPPKACTSEL